MGRFDKAVDVAHQGGLARTGKAHDAEDLARIHAEAYVLHADHRVEPVQDLRLVEIFFLDGLDDVASALAEDLPDVVDVDHLAAGLARHGSRPLPPFANLSGLPSTVRTGSPSTRRRN